MEIGTSTNESANYTSGKPKKKKFPKKSDQSNTASEAKGINKGSSGYSAYYDTGASPRSYFRDKPLHGVPSTGHVGTAEHDRSIPIQGTGKIRFGDLEMIDVAFVASFTKNLVSGNANHAS
jgi:hypothetical protein